MYYVVIILLTEEYLPFAKRKQSSKVRQRTKIVAAKPSTLITDTADSTRLPPKSAPITSKSKLPPKLTVKSVLSTKSTTVTDIIDIHHPHEPCIPLTTKHNTRGNLVEISIINCRHIIPQRFIKLIAVAVPYNQYLNKFTVRKGGLSQGNIYEISKMLPHSNITEVCLDDNYVRQGNYYVLLDELTSLKILSLCRCSINEIVCQNIIKRLEPGCPGRKLQSLSLSSNFIGDIGARKFGYLLRINRNLLHLNLADNGITNEGAAAILRTLKEFELNEHELLKRKKKRVAHDKNKIQAYRRIIAELATKRSKTMTSSSNSIGNSRKHKSLMSAKKETKPLKKVSSPKVSKENGLAYDMIRHIVTDFQDLFDDNNTVKKNNKMYCIGNMSLCYLNLAYNEFDEMILKMIRQVVTYQATLSKPSSCTGLIRLMIEGNPFSDIDEDLLFINALLTNLLPKY